MMKDPAAMWNLLQELDSCISEAMLARLQADLWACIDCDQVYSPKAEAKRHQIGTHLVHAEYVHPLWLASKQHGLDKVMLCVEQV